MYMYIRKETWLTLLAGSMCSSRNRAHSRNVLRARSRSWSWVDNSHGTMCYRSNKLETLIMTQKTHTTE